MQIRITRTPPGEAPEHVRQAWIGLVLPVDERYAGQQRRLGVGVLTGPRTWLGILLAMLTGRAKRQNGYVVEAKVALDLLAAHAPQAAEWWRTHAPHFLEPGRHFLFAAEVCKEVQDPKLSMPLHARDTAIWEASLPHDEAVMHVCMASSNYSGYVREAALAQMAAAPDRRYIPFILRRLGDWVPQVREQARKTLAKYKAPEFRKGVLSAIHDVEALLRVKRVDLVSVYQEIMRWLVHEADPSELLTEIGGLGDASRFRVIRYILAERSCSQEMVRTFLTDRSFLIRLATVRHLVKRTEDWTTALLEEAAADHFPSIRSAAVKELIRHDRASQALLTHWLTDPSLDVREMANKRLGLTRDDLLEHYRVRLKNGQGLVGCLLGLRDIKGTECTTEVLGYTEHTSPLIRQAALTSLAVISPDEAYYRALEMIVDANKRVRTKASAILLERHDQAVVERARALLASTDVMHRRAGLSLLNKYGGWTVLPDLLLACLDRSPQVAPQAWSNLDAWVSYARRLFTDASAQDLEKARAALAHVRSKLMQPSYSQQRALDAVQVFLN